MIIKLSQEILFISTQTQIKWNRISPFHISKLKVKTNNLSKNNLRNLELKRSSNLKLFSKTNIRILYNKSTHSTKNSTNYKPSIKLNPFKMISLTLNLTLLSDKINNLRHTFSNFKIKMRGKCPKVELSTGKESLKKKLTELISLLLI